jgi:hypothetical protein
MEKYGKYKMFQTTNQFRLDGHMIDIYMTWQHLRWDMAWIFVFMAPGDCLGARSSWPGSCQPIKLGMDYIYICIPPINLWWWLGDGLWNCVKMFEPH